MTPSMLTVAALYHFARFDDPSVFRAPLLELCQKQEITGTLLLANEGINGTISGPRAGIDEALSHIVALPGCADLEWKLSTASKRPFARMKVRLKREIVTMGRPDVDPRSGVGHYVEAADWNALIQSPDVVTIDTRNSYEVAIGSFDGAINPKTDSFRDFPAWWQANKKKFDNKRIAMFCTGGIRCEKSTNWLLSEGVSDVFHLKGGILKYLEEVPKEDSTWKGDCFVFDGRVSVGHGLREGPHILCHACRQPILPEDQDRPEFELGVSCHSCIATTSDIDKERFRERQRQITLSKARGERHLHAYVVDDLEN
jgi:UPF0176 protein